LNVACLLINCVKLFVLGLVSFCLANLSVILDFNS
jgi:hypothetical protein